MKAFHETVFFVGERTASRRKLQRNPQKKRRSRGAGRRTGIANGTGRDLNFRTEADEGTVTELHGTSTVSTCSSLYSSASFQCHEEEHNIWNSVVGLCCHYHIGQYIEEILTEEEMGRIAFFFGGVRESLQRRSFGKVITDATSGHVTYHTSVLRLNPWELAQAWYRESLLEQQLDRRCAVALVHVG